MGPTLAWSKAVAAVLGQFGYGRLGERGGQQGVEQVEEGWLVGLHGLVFGGHGFHNWESALFDEVANVEVMVDFVWGFAQRHKPGIGAAQQQVGGDDEQ